MISKIKKPVSILLALMMVVSLFTIVPMTVGAAPTESLLITINSVGYGEGDADEFISGSRTFDNIATVTFSSQVYNTDDDDGWYDMDSSDKILSVAPAAGYTITKVKFYNKYDSAFDETSPFEATLNDFEVYVNGSSCGVGGVNKIEVYGYATPAHTEHTYTANPTFNWSQDASIGDWNCNKLTLTCSDCDATQDYEVAGFFGASAVTCTANTDGSFTYSVSKKVGDVTYNDSKIYNAGGVVKSATQLKAAAKKGGEWELGSDIAEVTGVSCADGFVLDGNNKTLSAHTSVKTSPMFKSANKTAEYTLKNLTIDGVAGETQYQPAISSATTSTGQTNVINLEGVTITNYDFDQANNGAVLAFGQAKVNLTNCNIDTDSQYDVWGGAASTVNVDGGKVGGLYLNGGTSSANLTNSADVDSITAANGSKIATDAPEKISVGEDYKLKNNGDGTYTVVPKDYVAQVGTAKYETLEAAFAAAADGDTITLLADCTGNGIKAPQGKFATNGLTVDFAGHTYTVDGETVGSSGTETQAFQLLKNNKITFKGGTITSTTALMLVQNYSDLTLKDMTLDGSNLVGNNRYTLSNNNGNVVIDGSTITAKAGEGNYAFDVCRYSSYPSVNVTVTGNSQINGDVEISASGNNAKDGFSLKLESGKLNGDIVLDPSAKAAMAAAPEKAVVSKAATFEQDAPEGYIWVDTATAGVQTLAKAVAQIGGKKYATLEAAFAAAQDSDTITLLADCAGNGIKAPQGKFATGLTVDFGGYTYTVDGTTVGSTGTETNGFQLLKDNKITFRNGAITSTKAKILVQNYSNLTLDGMTLTLNNTGYNGAYTLSNNNGDVVINNTTINANPTTGSFAFDVCRFSSYPSVNVTVTANSHINGNVEISASKGDAKEGFSLTLESGDMSGDIVVDASAKDLIDDGCTVTKAADFEQDAPEGYKWNENNVLVPDYAALVNGTGYMTFAEAAAAANGETITLLKDAPAYVMTPGETLKVAKNGFKFSTPTVEGAYVVNAPAAVEGVITYTVSAAKVAYTTAAGKTTYSASLPSAFSSGTYKLLDDITRTTRMTPGVLASNVTLDLNGHTLTSTAPDYAIVLTRAGSAASPKTFALVDTSEQKGGKLVVNPAADQAIAVSGKYNNVTIGEGVTVDGGCVALTSENQNLTVNGTVNGGNDFAVVTNGKTTKNANITINDGAVVTSNVSAIYLPGTGTTTINGGTIEGKTAIYQKSGTLHINGGTIKGTGAATPYTYNGNGANATGDAIVVDSCGYPGGVPTVTISGNPTIKSTNGVQIGDYTYQDNTAPKVTATSNTMTLPIGLSWIPTETEGVYTVGAALFVAHSITLNGNIELNFFINPEFANFDDASSAKVKFSWDGNTTEVDLQDEANMVLSEDGWYKASVDLAAAEVASVVHAEVYLNNAKIGEDDYTVREYAEKLYKNPGAYDKKGKPGELRALAKALLNYGAMAQTVFAGDFTVKPEDFANANLDEDDKTAYASVTAEAIGAAIPEQASNMNKVADKLGGKFYTSSVIYLNQNKLRLYFTPKSYPGTLPYKYSGIVEGYYYYVESEAIPAAELDQQQHFEVGGVKFNYSALDYAKAVVESNMGPEAKNLAKALFCYYQAAKAYCG